MRPMGKIEFPEHQTTIAELMELGINFTLAFKLRFRQMFKPECDLLCCISPITCMQQGSLFSAYRDAANNRVVQQRAFYTYKRHQQWCYPRLEIVFLRQDRAQCFHGP